MEQKFESLHAASRARQRVQTRLQDLFMTLNETIYTEKNRGEKDENLILYCKNGIDPDPSFSGLITGKLYLDEEGNFSLALWPIDDDDNTIWRKEILLTHVQNFQFEFLGAKKSTTDRAITSELAWHKSWDIGRAEIPSQIRLTLAIEGELPLQYAFCIPRFDPIATYWERGKKP